MLLVSDPEIVKEIFIKEFSNFTNRPVSISTLGVIKLWNIGSAERYIYSICMCCRHGATYKWKVENGKIKIISFFVMFSS
jgi:hypothetical protein